MLKFPATLCFPHFSYLPMCARGVVWVKWEAVIQKTHAYTAIESGSVTANGKKLLDIIRILKDEEIDLELIKDNLHIRQKRSNFKLPTYKSNEFPLFPSIEEKPNIAIDSQILIESLKKILSII